jgi:adenylosuccinate lyase
MTTLTNWILYPNRRKIWEQDYFAAPFSEEALINRVLVEVNGWCEVPFTLPPAVDPDVFEGLKNIYKILSTEDALWIKETEMTNHDVKQLSTLSREKI